LVDKRKGKEVKVVVVEDESDVGADVGVEDGVGEETMDAE
jgi:hypothetical protein